MPIHFAPASNASSAVGSRQNRSVLAGILVRRAQDRVANDNAGSAPASDTVLRAALTHFAEHGLSAARAASSRAKEAHAAGDREAFDWWLAITCTLDRRLGAETERLLASKKQAN